MSQRTPGFSENDRCTLLRIARQAALDFFRPSLGPVVIERSIRNGHAGGVFVSLWNGRQLRGCVGAVGPMDNLCAQIQAVTAASLGDPRFCDDPVTERELPEITIEVSVLSEPWRSDRPEHLIPGVHGVIVRSGDRSGCFLPKVASEKGWSAEDFLSHCCTLKAGLPAKAWREPGCEVRLFEVEAFHEAQARGATHRQ